MKNLVLTTQTVVKKGTIVTVIAKRAYDICINNDLGGTQELPPGRYRVKLEKSWDDYEIGGRCIGTLVDKKDIEIARKAGTTGFTHEDIKKESPKYEIPKNKKPFQPERVFFGTTEIER